MSVRSTMKWCFGRSEMESCQLHDCVGDFACERKTSPSGSTKTKWFLINPSVRIQYAQVLRKHGLNPDMRPDECLSANIAGMSKQDLKSMAADFRIQAERLNKAADALDPPVRRQRRPRKPAEVPNTLNAASADDPAP